jgi:hypothetical protein
MVVVFSREVFLVLNCCGFGDLPGLVVRVIEAIVRLYRTAYMT